MTNALSRARGQVRRAVYTGVAAATVLAGQAVLTASPASAQVLLSESFAGTSTASGIWSMANAEGGHTPCLTAATVVTTGSLPPCNAVRDGSQQADPDGKGAFQLTNNARDETGGLVLNKALSAGQGLHIEFDQYQYNTSTYMGADGIAFFLIDGAKQASIGKPGGSLGYLNLDGAFVGVGFDWYGNFSNPKYWPAGDKGPGFAPNSVVLRGAQSTNYQYIKAVKSPAPLAVSTAKTRDEAQRTVNIDVSTANIMNVYIDYHDGKGKQQLLTDIDLDNLPGQPKLPSTIKLGFAGATGTYTDYHELRNFKITTLDPDLTLTNTAEGDFAVGGTGTFKLGVSDGAADGPTTGPTTTTFTIPAGMTYESASGDGWTCSNKGQIVTCTRPDILKAGQSFPEITIGVGVTGAVAETSVATGVVDTAHDFRAKNNTASATVTVTKGPDLALALTGGGTVKAGETGTLTATVTNAATAGPTTGPTTVTIPAPPGTTITKAAGDGWTCTLTGDKTSATCTNPALLKPGESFPPIDVKIAVPADAKAGDKKATATVDTAGDSEPSNDFGTATVKVVAATPPGAPDLAIEMGGHATCPSDCGTGSITARITNVGTAPTADKVTVTIPIPAPFEVTGVHGAGWDCKEGKEVVCTRPGTGPDALRPGEAFPKIIISTVIPALIVTGKVATTGDPNTINNSTTELLPPAEK